MKLSLYLIIVLLASTVHGAAPPGDGAVLQEELRAVQRLMVASGIAEEDAQVTLQAMVQARFTVEQIVRAGRQFSPGDQQLASAQAIREKIHEGIAKKVPAETVLAATAKVRSRYALAEQFAAELAVTNRQELVTLYADSLTAGLSDQGAGQLTAALRSVGDQNANSTGELAAEILLTARDMVRQNISSPTTVDLLEKALRQGYPPAEIRSLRQGLAEIKSELEKNAQRIAAAIDQGKRGRDLSGTPGGSGPKGSSSTSGGAGSGGGSQSGGEGPGSDNQGSSSNSGGAGSDGGSSGGGGNDGGGKGGGGNN